MLKINTNLIKAANVVSNKEETRYYMNGVYIEATAERVFYAATDGYRLVAFHHAAEWNDGVEEKKKKISIIIPNLLIKNMKMDKFTSEADLRLSEDGMWLVAKENTVSEFIPVDGIFPDWRRVIPQKTNGELAQFNGDYIASFKKIGRIIGAAGTVPAIYHNGAGPALIDLGTTEYDYVACIMPIHHSATFNQEMHRPYWIKAH